MIPRQAVILCGGYGTRLGPLTASTPKPLLPVTGQPFLEILIEELARQGVREFILLAAFEADKIKAFAKTALKRLDLPISIEVEVEDTPAGTGGALRQAREQLAPRFLLLNGDSWFDILVADIAMAELRERDAVGALALRRVWDGGRYGVVDVSGETVTGFRERGDPKAPALINGGVYCFKKEVVDSLSTTGSLERDGLPKLAADGRLIGVEKEGFFLDIGVPEAFEAAQTMVPQQRRRPAVIFDRDGVLNIDHGHVGQIDRFDWTPQAVAAIRAVNEAGWLAFIATNQAGIGKGFYTEEDYFLLREHMRRDLALQGAHIDDERYCPTHPEAVLREFKMVSDRRKPGPGMLKELRERWSLDWDRSVMIGDKATDMEAADAAGVSSLHFKGGDLSAVVKRWIASH